MEYIKLQQKVKKWIGKKAATTAQSSVFGVPGVVEDVKITPMDYEGKLFKLYFLINYGKHKLLSSEENTVIYLNS